MSKFCFVENAAAGTTKILRGGCVPRDSGTPGLRCRCHRHPTGPRVPGTPRDIPDASRDDDACAGGLRGLRGFRDGFRGSMSAASSRRFLERQRHRHRSHARGWHCLAVSGTWEAIGANSANAATPPTGFAAFPTFAALAKAFFRPRGVHPKSETANGETNSAL